MWANFVAAWFDTCAFIGSVLGGIAAVIVAVLLLAAFVIILLAIVDLLFDKSHRGNGTALGQDRQAASPALGGDHSKGAL